MVHAHVVNDLLVPFLPMLKWRSLTKRCDQRWHVVRLKTYEQAGRQAGRGSRAGRQAGKQQAQPKDQVAKTYFVSVKWLQRRASIYPSASFQVALVRQAWARGQGNVNANCFHPLVHHVGVA